MNSGRELDALVAAKVMGWEHERDAELRHKCNGKFHTRCGSCGEEGHGNCYGFGRGAIQIECNCTPPYSTDIATAWEIVEKMGALEWCFDINLQARYSAVFRRNYLSQTPRFSASEESAPHAICLAALKAVGHKFEEEK